MKRVILNMAAVLGIAALALCMTQPANAAAITIDFSRFKRRYDKPEREWCGFELERRHSQ